MSFFIVNFYVNSAEFQYFCKEVYPEKCVKKNENRENKIVVMYILRLVLCPYSVNEISFPSRFFRLSNYKCCRNVELEILF